MEEVKRPEKVIPRATVLSLVIVAVLYLLVNFFYMLVLTPTEMVQANAVAVVRVATIGFFKYISSLLHNLVHLEIKERVQTTTYQTTVY